MTDPILYTCETLASPGVASQTPLASLASQVPLVSNTEVLEKEIEPIIEKLKTEADYVLVKFLLVSILSLGLASLRAEMSDKIAEMWKTDIYFTPLWGLVNFDSITSLSRKFGFADTTEGRRAKPGDMSASRYSQTGHFHIPENEEENLKAKGEFLSKLHILDINYPHFLPFEEVTMDTPLDHMQKIYQVYLDRIHEEHEMKMYESMKQMIKVSLLLGSKMMEKFLSAEIYSRLRDDPALSSLWGMISDIG